MYFQNLFMWFEFHFKVSRIKKQHSRKLLASQYNAIKQNSKNVPVKNIKKYKIDMHNKNASYSSQ